jgi:hypothetical protein
MGGGIITAHFYLLAIDLATSTFRAVKYSTQDPGLLSKIPRVLSF